jgi:hypothetical protein
MGLVTRRAAEGKGILYRRCKKGKKIACRRLKKRIEDNPDAGIVYPSSGHPDYLPSNSQQEEEEEIYFEEPSAETETFEEGNFPWNEPETEAMNAKAPETNLQQNNSGVLLLFIIVGALIFFMNRKGK